MKAVLFVVALVASTFTASLFGSQSSSSMQNTPSTPNTLVPAQTTGGLSSQFVGQVHQGHRGISAIHPHLNLTSTSASANVPTFTRDDVINFIMNVSPSVYHAETVGKPVISQVDFLTVDQAEHKYKLGLQSLPASQLICVVVFDNQVVFSRGPNLGDVTSQGAYEVFDALTGNFIVSFSKI